MRRTLLALVVLVAIGCSSRVRPGPAQREGLAAFLEEPVLVHQPRGLVVDRQLELLGQAGSVMPLVDATDWTEATRTLMLRLRDSAAPLRDAPIELVQPRGGTPPMRPPGAPVLFVWTEWRVTYPRVPPQMNRLRLELGVIAKVIPYQQVLDGNGPIALRSALWEGNCVAQARAGAALTVREWLAEEATPPLRSGIEELASHCAEKLTADFLREVRR